MRIVTASDDKTARIWDVATGKPIGEPLEGHNETVYSAAFSPDGNAHRHRVWRQDGAASGTPRPVSRSASRSGMTARVERCVQPRRQAHRHRVFGQDRAHLGRRDRQADRRAAHRPSMISCRALRSALTARGSSPRLRQDCSRFGTPRPASRSASRSNMMILCRARRSAPTAPRSSPRPGTRRRASGTPRLGKPIG